MFEIGVTYYNGEGKRFTVLYYFEDRIYPIIAMDDRKVLSAYTAEGRYYRAKTTEKDLRLNKE